MNRHATVHRRAALTVCRKAVDAADAAMLLAMLGLDAAAITAEGADVVTLNPAAAPPPRLAHIHMRDGDTHDGDVEDGDVDDVDVDDVDVDDVDAAPTRAQVDVRSALDTQPPRQDTADVADVPPRQEPMAKAPAVGRAQADRCCVDCGRRIVPQTRWRHMTPAQREGRALSAAHGLCAACYTRARYHGTLPAPAPRKPTPAGPTTTIVATYDVRCDQCGPVYAGNDRGTAFQRRRQHQATHRPRNEQHALTRPGAA
jgi:hypothetical protein